MGEIFDPSKLSLNLDWDEDDGKKEEDEKNENQEEEQKENEWWESIWDSQSPDNDEKTEQDNEKKDEDSPEENNDEKKEDQEETEDDAQRALEPLADVSVETDEVIYDVNINTLDDLTFIVVSNDYDFFVLEPQDSHVKIVFKKDKLEKEERNIRLQTYSKILIKVKTIAKLNLEKDDIEQKWEWDYGLKDKTYKVVIKTVPSPFWEKVFVKPKEIIVDTKWKKKKKWIPIGKVLTFFSALAVITLILGWWFLAFLVMNTNTIEDVKFFSRLWISLNDVNTFMLSTIWAVFGILLFIESIFLMVFIFKILLTKKEYKKKRTTAIMMSLFFLTVASITWVVWKALDQKVRNMPNWQEVAYWDVKLYDNEKLLSPEIFGKDMAIIKDTKNLIWPVTIKFDLSNFARNEASRGIKIKKFVWDFWDKKPVEELTPIKIFTFDEAKVYNVKLNVEVIDIKWDYITKEVGDIPIVDISYLVKKNIKTLPNGWKQVEFDASDLSNLWQLEWYFVDDLQNPVYEGQIFTPSKIFYDETVVWLYIAQEGRNRTTLDKVFIIKWEDSNEIRWKVAYKQSVDNDLEFTLSIEDPETEFGRWFIEKLEWHLEDSIETVMTDPADVAWTTKITYTFTSYWDKNVKVLLYDSSGKSREVTAVVPLPKKLKLQSKLKITNNGVLLEEEEDYSYVLSNNEYIIQWIWVPTTLHLDARRVKGDTLRYTLKEVKWDLDNDGTFDKVTKEIDYKVPVEWDYWVWVQYKFIHRKNPKDIVTMKESVVIEWIKKDAIIDIKIIKDTEYAPAVVKFDASKSVVQNDNIVKFIYDYWDGTKPEVRDAHNPWHRYVTPWDYIVTLKVVTENWKEFSTSENIILKPRPETIKLTASMYEAPSWQWIDFSSVGSQWHIVNYIWQFWDDWISQDANPTHAFEKPWEYTVKLQLEFSNRNVLEETLKITITE